MATPFLVGFSQRVIVRLLDERLVDLVPGGETRAMLYVANALAAAGEGRQLLSSLEKALLECPEVNELFADRDALKVIVEGLGQQ